MQGDRQLVKSRQGHINNQPGGAGKLTSSLPVVIQPALLPELSRPVLLPGEIMNQLEEKKKRSRTLH